MPGLLGVGAEIIRPDPDSQYRLLTPCECGSAEVVYTRRITIPGGVKWVAGCLTCGKCTRPWGVQHHAQIEWNGGKRPSWERD